MSFTNDMKSMGFEEQDIRDKNLKLKAKACLLRILLSPKDDETLKMTFNEALETLSELIVKK